MLGFKIILLRLVFQPMFSISFHDTYLLTEGLNKASRIMVWKWKLKFLCALLSIYSSLSLCPLIIPFKLLLVLCIIPIKLMLVLCIKGF